MPFRVLRTAPRPVSFDEIAKGNRTFHPRRLFFFLSKSRWMELTLVYWLDTVGNRTFPTNTFSYSALFAFFFFSEAVCSFRQKLVKYTERIMRLGLVKNGIQSKQKEFRLFALVGHLAWFIAGKIEKRNDFSTSKSLKRWGQVFCVVENKSRRFQWNGNETIVIISIVHPRGLFSLPFYAAVE